MKSYNLKTLIFALILLVSIQVVKAGHYKGILLQKIGNPGDITVGSRTSDSTGFVSISNSLITSAVINGIHLFNGWEITNQQSTLSVSVKNCYLLFKLRKPTGDTATVAVQLKEGENNTLVFRPHSETDVVFFTTFGNSTACNFLKDWNKSITGCSCSSPTTQTPSGCKFYIISLSTQ